MPHSVLGGIVYAVAPTILVGLLFWFAMRAIVRSDRTERKVYAEIELEERARAEAEERAAAARPGRAVAAGSGSAGSASAPAAAAAPASAPGDV